MRRDSGSGIRWVSLLPLSLTVMVAFGIMFYGFSVYLTTEAAGSDFSTTVLSLAYSGAVLAGGLMAMPVGAYADRHGVKLILGLGSILGFLGLLAFAAAEEPWHVVVAWWLLIGPAGAMTFYEPAFVAVNQWCTPQQRPRALATLTVIGGLAGIIFIPGTERLVAIFGWRQAAVILGMLLLATGGGTALFAIPRSRSVRDSAESPAPKSGALRNALRDRRYRLYTLAMMLSFFAAQGVFSHRLARFEETGFAVAAVALWAAVASALSLPTRWLAPHAATRFRATTVQASATVVIGVSVLLMADGGTSWHLIGHFVLFGIGFGALLPLRAMVMADWFSGSSYGRIMGAQWTAVGLAGAAGPVTVGLLRDQVNGYGLPTALIAAVYLAAAVLIFLSDSEHKETLPAGRCRPPRSE
jgi:MFS family permease